MCLCYQMHSTFFSFAHGLDICFAMALFAMAAKLGPPDQKRYTLCIYKDESSCNKGGNPEVEVELLKALGSRETSEVPICIFKLFAFFCYIYMMNYLFHGCTYLVIDQLIHLLQWLFGLVPCVASAVCAGAERTARSCTERSVHHQLFREE